MDNLIGREFLQDKRYQEGKKLLLEALSAYKAKITKVLPPKPELQGEYHERIQRANALRGNSLFYPYLGSGIGNGMLVELADGSVKYDLISGIGVNYFGHSFEKLIDCTIDASMQDTIMQGNLQQNVDSVDLMELLVKVSKMEHVFLTTSGAMANENALKIIFQKKHPAHRLIAFDGCFMGRTLTLSQITDKPSFREGLPSNIFVDYIPFYDQNNPEASTEACVKALKNHLSRHPGEYAAICLELVQGERGFYTGSREFFHTICKICKDAGLAIFVDEVQTFARTHELFAFHYFALEYFADVVTIGKVSQVCATFWKKEFNPKPGLLSQTFIGSTSAIQACRFGIEYLLQSRLFGPNGKIHEVHAWFKSRLEELQKRHPGIIEGPYGIGSMIAFTPFGGEKDKVNNFVQKLFHNGVISFVAGSNPTRARFLVPAEIIKIEDVNAVMEIVEKTLIECKNEKKS
jgi:acetylornithine/succinyldiaminopimelate/putrescine aminotransferase